MLTVLLSLLACDLPISCNDNLVWSVRVSLVDPYGEPILDPDAVVLYTVDGGEEQTCEGGGGGVWACGRDERGDFVITADAWGHDEASVEVSISGDICHVDPQFIDLELPYLDCTADVRPSVLVEVVDESGAPVTNAELGFVPQDELWTNPEPCAAGADGVYVCGEEHGGLLDIWIDAEGFQSETIEVDVPFDECHVETQEVQVELLAD